MANHFIYLRVLDLLCLWIFSTLIDFLEFVYLLHHAIVQWCCFCSNPCLGVDRPTTLEMTEQDSRSTQIVEITYFLLVYLKLFITVHPIIKSTFITNLTSIVVLTLSVEVESLKLLLKNFLCIYYWNFQLKIVIHWHLDIHIKANSYCLIVLFIKL